MNADDDLEKKGLARLEEALRESPMLTIEQPKFWLTLLCILGVLAALILWAFLGKIPIEVEGRSVALSSNGVALIESPAKGALKTLYAKEGDFVYEGEPMAQFSVPELGSLLSAIKATQFKIEGLSQQELLLQKALSINIGLFQKGLIAKMVIDQSRSEVTKKKIEVEDAKAALNDTFSRLRQHAFASQEKFQHFRQLLDAPSDVVDFPSIQKELSTLPAPSKGKILEVLVNPGEQIKEMDPLFWMENPPSKEAPIVFYATFDAKMRRRLHKGQKVFIEPATVDPKKYGAIIGKIEEIYPYPVSKEELMQTVGNGQIVQYLLDDEKALVNLTIHPELDPTTKSGFKWTSEEGPPFKVETGTVASMRVLVEEQRPISYLIQFWKVN